MAKNPPTTEMYLQVYQARRAGTPVYKNLICGTVNSVHLIVYAFTTLKFRTKCCQYLNEFSF